MVDWRETTWGDEVNLSYGKALKGYSKTGGPYRVFGSNGPVGWTGHALIPGPGVILGRKGAYRGVRYSAQPFYVIDTAYYLVPKSELDMRWLYYAVVHYKLGDIDDGSPIPSTTRSAVYVRDLAVPPLSEQHSIASVLAALDDKIDLNRRMNETLEAMARAIFKDWFVDFGPVRAKAEGRQPPGLAPDIAAMFPDTLDVDGKPVGWEAKRIGDVLELAYGKSLPATSRSPGRNPVYGSGGITGYHAEPLISGPSVIVGRKGTVGTIFWEDRQAYPIDTVFYVVPKEMPLTYCYYLLMILGIEDMNTDAAIPGLNRNNVYRLERATPPRAICACFDKIVRPLHDRIWAAKRESESLTALRDLLLPKLMSGEIRIRDAEALVSEAA